MPRNESVQSVIRAFILLDMISREQEIGISELTRKSGFKKTTVARLVSTLVQTGLVEQNPSTQCFMASIKLFELGNRTTNYLDIRQQARFVVEKYVSEHQRSVLIGVLNNKEVVYIDKIEASSEPFRIRVSIGNQAPVYCTASGKAILAFLDIDERKKIWQQITIKSFTENTLTDFMSLERDLEITRERGYSIDKKERFDSLYSVGAPVFNFMGKVIASISVPRLVGTITDDELNKLGEEVARMGITVSQRMGWKMR